MAKKKPVKFIELKKIKYYVERCPKCKTRLEKGSRFVDRCDGIYAIFIPTYRCHKCKRIFKKEPEYDVVRDMVRS